MNPQCFGFRIALMRIPMEILIFIWCGSGFGWGCRLSKWSDPDSDGDAGYRNDRIRIHNIGILDPDLYWECGSGSKGICWYVFDLQYYLQYFKKIFNVKNQLGDFKVWPGSGSGSAWISIFGSQDLWKKGWKKEEENSLLPGAVEDLETATTSISDLCWCQIQIQALHIATNLFRLSSR